MVWFIVFVVIIAGKPIELVGTQTFNNAAECNAELAKFTQIGVTHSWGVTCVSEGRA